MHTHINEKLSHVHISHSRRWYRVRVHLRDSSLSGDWIAYGKFLMHDNDPNIYNIKKTAIQ